MLKPSTLLAFLFINNDQVIKNLKSELSTYLALVDGVPGMQTHCNGGSVMKESYHTGVRPARRFFLCQPSSAAVERVFSILKTTSMTANRAPLRTMSRVLLCCSSITIVTEFEDHPSVHDTNIQTRQLDTSRV